MIKSTYKLCFIGDSITEGVGTNKRYFDYIAGVPIGEFFTEHTENVVTEYDENDKPIHYALRKKREPIIEFTDTPELG